VTAEDFCVQYIVTSGPFCYLGPGQVSCTHKLSEPAAISSTALVFTPDLFPVVQYIVGREDPEFARLCRQALLRTTGRVTFPAVPVVAVPQIETELEQVNSLGLRSVGE
jgi:hypothetical protein